jgi:hypothetical protein
LFYFLAWALVVINPPRPRYGTTSPLRQWSYLELEKLLHEIDIPVGAIPEDCPLGFQMFSN